MTHPDTPVEYPYSVAGVGHSDSYLLPSLARFLAQQRPARIFEIGCGNGSTASWLQRRGIEVVGIDASASGIAIANESHPGIKLETGSAYEDLPKRFGHFRMVLSLEVIEHLIDPRRFVKNAFDLLEPGGTAFISTPYHGYLKNLALAISGKFDAHFTALWDGGHIKFFSMATLGELLREAGFVDIRFERVGRVPWLAKSMIAIARKPGP